jgi:hypothetical protein
VAVRPRSPRLHGYPPKSPFQRSTELGGGRRLRDACAGPEVETASTNVLREFGSNRQKPLEMTANQGPQHEGPEPEAKAPRATCQPASCQPGWAWAWAWAMGHGPAQSVSPEGEGTQGQGGPGLKSVKLVLCALCKGAGPGTAWRVLRACVPKAESRKRKPKAKFF